MMTLPAQVPSSSNVRVIFPFFCCSWAKDMSPIKALSPKLFFAKHRISPSKPSSEITVRMVPAIGLMPAASAFLKNFTMPNILFKSVKAMAGICNFTALAIISLILSRPLEILYSEEALRCMNDEFIAK